MFRIAKEQLQALFAFLAETKDVYLPIKKGEQVNYGLWNADATVDLDTLKTVTSPKDCFFPQSENLYTCTIQGKQISIEPEAFADRAFVVFGVKGCDVKGLEVLDKVFLSEPVDNFYEKRREHGCIISLACKEPKAACFCKVFDIDASNPDADVVTWLTDDYLFWDGRTEKGKHLTDEISQMLESVEDSAPVEEQKRTTKEKIESLPYSGLSLEKFKPEKLNEIFNLPKWEELYQACLACGTCTFICPTCQCYDIKDFNTGKDVKKYRCWDSCMYSDFTLMAHGNPRKTQMERFRQRFMHKLVYFPANNEGLFSCVGCGRCVNKCPSSLNIVKVIKSLEGSIDV